MGFGWQWHTKSTCRTRGNLSLSPAMEGIAAGSLAPIYGSSKKTRQRRRAKREKKGGKSGNPGLFHGSRAIFLQSHLSTFVLLKNANRKAQNDFWNQIFADYWRNWPWHLPLDQEPEDCDWPVPNTELPDVLAAKGQVIKQTQKVVFDYCALIPY